MPEQAPLRTTQSQDLRPLETPLPLDTPQPLSTGYKKRTGPKKVLIPLLVAMVLLVAGAGGGYLWYESQLGAVAPQSTEKVRVVVKKGSTTSEIADLLAQKQLIKSSFAFETYYRFNHGDGLQAGTYLLAKNQSVHDIVTRLESGKVDEFGLTFLPGETLDATKKTLLAAGYSDDMITKAFSAQYDLPLFAGRPAGSDIEGFVYGDTYSFYANSSLEEILAQPFKHMYEYIQTEKLETAFAAQGMTLYQGVTLASIIQKEVSNKADMQHVSQVFHTRLTQGITLGSDVTFIYGAKKLGAVATPSLDSPYNTRIVKGLPPTPIATPSKEALYAAAFPLDTSDLFFVAGDDGTTYFSKTNAEHEALTQKYCKKNCQEVQ